MNINFTPWAILWSVLAIVVLVMAGYRKIISGKEDETLHLSSPTANAEQVTVGHKLEVIDKWGKLLTIIAAAFGVLLGLAYTYQTWVQSSRLGQ